MLITPLRSHTANTGLVSGHNIGLTVTNTATGGAHTDHMT